MTKRPTIRDERVLQAAAKELLAEFNKGTGEGLSEDDALYSIVEAITWEDDGFRICRELENNGWDCDAEMVDIMDNAAAYKYRHHRELLAEWVKENSITPPLCVSARVRFVHRGEQRVGTIRSINADAAEYTVFCEELGHVREGLGTHGTIVKYEDCWPDGHAQPEA